MADIKLFRLDLPQPKELEAHSAQLEKSLQHLIEKHLDVFLGVRFLASEYTTGKKHRGRIERGRGDGEGLEELAQALIVPASPRAGPPEFP